MLTGWAMDAGAPFRYGADACIPLSDHADYAALLRYIELAQPRKVLLNHGWKDFAWRLRRWASTRPTSRPTSSSRCSEALLLLARVARLVFDRNFMLWRIVGT